MNPNEVDNTHFCVERIIGKGGFGTVHYVTARGNSGKGYARKSQQKYSMVNSSSGVNMAFNELETLRVAKSPFICNIQHAYQDLEFCYIILDVALGGDLEFQRTHRFKDKTLPENIVKFCMAEVYVGLRYLHSMNVLHRDIKPANMLLQQDGHIKLTDFGISVRVKDINKDQIQNGSGTDGFMAPEIFKGTHGVASEWWSYAICLHELMAGKLPVQSTKGLAYNPSVSRMKKSSSDAKDLTTKLLQLKPADRLTGEQIKDHGWFADIDWVQIEKREAKPPYLPDCKEANCSTGNLDIMNQLGADVEVIPMITAKQNEQFAQYRHAVTINNED